MVRESYQVSAGSEGLQRDRRGQQAWGAPMGCCTVLVLVAVWDQHNCVCCALDIVTYKCVRKGVRNRG